MRVSPTRLAFGILGLAGCQALSGLSGLEPGEGAGGAASSASSTGGASVSSAGGGAVSNGGGPGVTATSGPGGGGGADPVPAALLAPVASGTVSCDGNCGITATSTRWLGGRHEIYMAGFFSLALHEFPGAGGSGPAATTTGVNRYGSFLMHAPNGETPSFVGTFRPNTGGTVQNALATGVTVLDDGRVVMVLNFDTEITGGPLGTNVFPQGTDGLLWIHDPNGTTDQVLHLRGSERELFTGVEPVGDGFVVFGEQSGSASLIDVLGGSGNLRTLPAASNIMDESQGFALVFDSDGSIGNEVSVLGTGSATVRAATTTGATGELVLCVDVDGDWAVGNHTGSSTGPTVLLARPSGTIPPVVIPATGKLRCGSLVGSPAGNLFGGFLASSPLAGDGSADFPDDPNGDANVITTAQGQVTTVTALFPAGSSGAHVVPLANTDDSLGLGLLSLLIDVAGLPFLGATIHGSAGEVLAGSVGSNIDGTPISQPLDAFLMLPTDTGELHVDLYGGSDNQTLIGAASDGAPSPWTVVGGVYEGAAAIPFGPAPAPTGSGSSDGFYVILADADSDDVP